MDAIPVGQAVLQKMAEMLGGPHEVAELLGISRTQAKQFIDGTAPVPESVLIRAIDIILGAQAPLFND